MEDNIKKDSQEEVVVTSKNKSKLDVNSSLLVIIVILVIMSGVQVFQMQSISNAIANGSIKTNAQTQGSTTGLPSQVGGCG